jgi:hypothetical protein
MKLVLLSMADFLENNRMSSSNRLASDIFRLPVVLHLSHSAYFFEHSGTRSGNKKLLKSFSGIKLQLKATHQKISE